MIFDRQKNGKIGCKDKIMISSLRNINENDN